MHRVSVTAGERGALRSATVAVLAVALTAVSMVSPVAPLNSGTAAGSTPPVIDSVSITPASPQTNDVLTANVVAHQDNGDPLTYSYQWIKNGADLAGATGPMLNLAQAANGDKNDVLAVRVTAFDGATSSAPVVAASGAIYNSLGVNQTAQPVALPTNIAVGDLLVVVLPYDGGGGTTWPAGWTKLLDKPNGSHGLSIAYRKADGSEGATATVTTAAEQAVGFSYRVAGWDGTTPPELASATGLNTTPDPPALTPSWGSANTLWLAAYGINGGPSTAGVTFPLTDQKLWARTGGSGASGGAVCSQVISTATLDPTPFSNATNDAWVAATLAIRPASGGATASVPVTSPSVTVVNSPPVFGQDLADRTNAEKDVVSLSAVASDPDGDALSYSAAGLPAGLSINTTSGLITGTIATGAAKSSPYSVGITVTDGTGPNPVDTFTWTITAAAQAPPFSFGVAGDLGANTRTSSVLSAVPSKGTSQFFAIGDLSYSEVTPESAWCSYVQSKVGATYPYELLAGTHEDDGTTDGQIGNFAACLPNRLGPPTGSYGQEYYIDYPAGAPLVRFVMISPGLTFPGSTSAWSYNKGSAHYTWTANAIDTAHAAGIPWVVVGMHRYCLADRSDAGCVSQDLMNLLVGRKVDLYLQAHNHVYERTKQLALNASCPAIALGTFNAACVADANPASTYTAGKGTVLATVGTGGEGLGSGEDPNSPAAPYFQTFMGSNYNGTYGYLNVNVTATSLSATYIRGTGGSYTDAFTITKP
jgi:hypothetical protein